MSDLTTADGVLKWARACEPEEYWPRGLQLREHSAAKLYVDEAIAARIAKAMCLWDVWEKVDGDVYDALQEGKCSEYACDAIRAALGGAKP